jgi:hypothetical protein
VPIAGILRLIAFDLRTPAPQPNPWQEAAQRIEESEASQP